MHLQSLTDNRGEQTPQNSVENNLFHVEELHEIYSGDTTIQSEYFSLERTFNILSLTHNHPIVEHLPSSRGIEPILSVVEVPWGFMLRM